MPLSGSAGLHGAGAVARRRGTGFAPRGTSGRRGRAARGGSTLPCWAWWSRRWRCVSCHVVALFRRVRFVLLLLPLLAPPRRQCGAQVAQHLNWVGVAEHGRAQHPPQHDRHDRGSVEEPNVTHANGQAVDSIALPASLCVRPRRSADAGRVEKS